MTAWSDYLRQQAIAAEHLAKTMTTPESQKEFVDIAASFRRDADLEDGTAIGDDRAIRMPQRNVSTSLKSLHG